MLEFLQTAPLYIIPFLLMLGVVVTVHELGHFLAARWMGISVDRFSIGFGKPIAHWNDKAGVEWRIGWLPLGGYVRFSGDENEASIPDQEHLDEMRRAMTERGEAHKLDDYFQFRPVWQRAVVTAAGPVANFILAISFFAILFGSFGEVVVPPRIANVVAGSPAERAGFRSGDLILSADGASMKSFQQLHRTVALRSDTPIAFVVERGGAKVTILATPKREATKDLLGNTQKLGYLGLEPVAKPVVNRYGPLAAIGRGAQETWTTITTTVDYIGRMIVGREGPDQLSGPLGLAHMSGDLAKLTAKQAPDAGSLAMTSLIRFLNFTAAISVGIGFINLLPIPVLDGGHLLFYAYEALARRPLAAKVQAVGYRAGLALVLGLMLFATWNDLQRLRVFSLLAGLGA
ncbi:MAG TPA: RIP metalloprotease RseP [Phenylobacterium sp.]